MSTLSFSEDEIETDGDISATVNPAGLAYVGRRHKGKTVRILVLKGSERTEPRYSCSPKSHDTPDYKSEA